MGITGCEYAYLLVFQRDTTRYLSPLRIEADWKLIEKNNRLLANFGAKYVEKDIPPPFSSLDDLRIAYPSEDQGKTKKAPEHIVSRYHALKQVRERFGQLGKLEDSLKIDLQKAMGKAELLVDGDQKLASWKSQTRNRFDTVRFKQEHPKLYKQYLTKNTTRVFRLS